MSLLLAHFFLMTSNAENVMSFLQNIITGQLNQIYVRNIIAIKSVFVILLRNELNTILKIYRYDLRIFWFYLFWKLE